VYGRLGHLWSWPEWIYRAALGAAAYFRLVHSAMLSVLFLVQSEQKASWGPRRYLMPLAHGLFHWAVFSFYLWKGRIYNS
jgi:hypothetical protein